MITLRHFCLEDAEALHSLFYPELSMAGIADMIRAWDSRVYQGKYFEMFAVAHDGAIVGCASLCERSSSVASAGIEIAPAERKKGFATEAMAALLDFAAKKGCRIILDQVRTDNPASIRLHEKLGFASDGYVYRNQREHAVFVFVKPL